MNLLDRIVATRIKVLVTSTESSPRKCSCSDHWASQMVLNYKTEKFKPYNLAICSVLCPIWHKYHLGFAYEVQKLSRAKLSWFLKIWIQRHPEQSGLWKDGNWEALSIEIAGSQRGSLHGDTVAMDPSQQCPTCTSCTRDSDARGRDWMTCWGQVPTLGPVESNSPWINIT